MGQKVNPHGLRVGVIKEWDSKWYAEKDFADNLVEDHEIRTFLKKRLYLSLIHILFGVKCTALSMCGLGGLPAFFGDTFVIWCILMAVSFVGAFLITILIGFKDIPEEEA